MSELRGAYLRRKPFAHAVLDNLFPKRLLDDLIRSERWNVADNATAVERCQSAQGWRCIMHERTGFLKMSLNDELRMSAMAQGFLAALKARPFINFLEELTGIRPLYPDEYNEGGGLHETGRGGSLQVHADFRQHPLTTMERRVNAFIYLNKDWDDAWGGELELWDRTMRKCVQKIDVNFGRFVVFSSHDFSYHGHPEPLACPADRSRKSMAFYYYSPIPRPPDTVDTNFPPDHVTLYQADRYRSTPCGICSDQHSRAPHSESQSSSSSSTHTSWWRWHQDDAADKETLCALDQASVTRPETPKVAFDKQMIAAHTKMLRPNRNSAH